MDGDGTPLSIDARAKHGGGADHHTDVTTVHPVDELLLLLFRAGILDKLYLVGRYVVLADKPVLQFLIDAPLTLLGRGEVTEDELRAPLLIILIIDVTDILCGNAYLRAVTLMVVRIDELRAERAFLAHIGDEEHLGLLLAVTELGTEHEVAVTALGKLQEPLLEVLLVLGGLDVHELNVHVRTLQAHVGSGLVVGDLVIEGAQLRHLDKLTETLLHHDAARYVDLIVAALTGKDGGPRIKAVDVLHGHGLRTEVLEQQVQLRKAVADGRAGEEGGTEVTARALLNGTDGVLEVTRTLAAFRVAETGHTAVPRGEGKVLECLALVDEDMVDAHRLEIGDIIGTAGKGGIEGEQLALKVLLTLLQTGTHTTADAVPLTLIDLQGLVNGPYLFIQDFPLDVG